MYRYFCTHCGFWSDDMTAVIKHLFTLHELRVLRGGEDWRTELRDPPGLIDAIVESAA